MNFKINLGDSHEVIDAKLKKIHTYNETMKEPLLEAESNCLNNIVRNLKPYLQREDFSCKNGVLIYEFKHDNTDRDVYISPEVYLIENDCIVYEVYNPKGYNSVSKNPIYKSQAGKYFCEITLKQFLNYVTLEDLLIFLDNYINKDYIDVQKLIKREEFLKSITKH